MPQSIKARRLAGARVGRVDALAAARPALRERYERLLEPGPERLSETSPPRTGSPLSKGAADVLLIDDSLTSGAKLQSATTALTAAGPTVVAGLVLGRVVDVSEPDRFPETAGVLGAPLTKPFTFETCCLE
jgi:hypothetical protein